MEPTGKKILMFVLALSLLLLARGMQAQEELEIEIGPASPAVAKHSHDHDVTVDALEQGKTKYTLGSHPDDSHSITLTKREVADILEGTTNIIRSSKDEDGGKVKGHQHRITITYTGEEPESSGW